MIAPVPAKKARPAPRAAWWTAGGSAGGTRLALGEPLSTKTTLRVGGPARYFAEPNSVDDLCGLLEGASRGGVPVFVLGRGSNLIVVDEGFDGLVLRLSAPCFKEVHPVGDDRLYAGGGARLKQVCGTACGLGLSGFEFLEGIPGSVGGSLRMNAGAMGGWMFERVEEVVFATLDGRLERRGAEAFTVGYRECRELAGAVALGAVLRSSGRVDPGEIKERLERFGQQRKGSQPREASAGCIFKNPEGGHAGQLIDELGLKGRRVGAAQVSEVHGNFIVNRGGASSAEVLGLVRELRDEVRERRGIDLQPEVLLLGRSWEEVLA